MPRFDRLNFYHYSRRLRAELVDLLVPKIINRLVTALPGAEVKAAWIALKAERSGGGLIAGAAWFADDPGDEARVSEPFVALVGRPEKTEDLSPGDVFRCAMQTGYLQSRILEALKDCEVTARSKNSSDQIKQILADSEKKKEFLREAFKTCCPEKKKKLKESARVSYCVVCEYVKSVLSNAKRYLQAAFDADWEQRTINRLSNELCDAYAAPDWDLGYAGQLAADCISSDCVTLQQAKQDLYSHDFVPDAYMVPTGTHPRDLVMNDGAVVFVCSRGHMSGNAFTKDATHTVACIADMTGSPCVCKFQDELDFTARFMLEWVQLKGLENVAVLTLLPIRRQEGGISNALLAAVCLLPIKQAKKLIPMLRNPGQKLNSYASGEAEIVMNLARQLFAVSKEFGGTLPLVESLDSLSEVFLYGTESVGKAISSFDVEEMRGRAQDVGNIYVAEERALKRLMIRKKEAEQGSPLGHPLDVICTDILGFMRELLSAFEWQELINPLQKFANQEKLLLGSHERRDHYIHTLKVYLLGRRFLLQGGAYTEFIRPRWLLASLLHDTCYPIQKAEDWLGEYVQSLMQEGVIGEVSTRSFMAKWKGRGYEACWFDVLLRLVDYRLGKWLSGATERPRRFQASALFNLIEERNHAVLGAISLLMRAQEVYPHLFARIDDPTRLLDYGWRNKQENKRLSQLFDAATAIILHDPNVWDALAFDGSRVRFRPSVRGFEGKVAQMVWALAVSDVIQEWGRDLNLGAEVRKDLGNDYFWRVPKEVQLELGQGLTINIFYKEEFADRVRELKDRAYQELRDCMRTSGFGDIFCDSINDIGDDGVRPSKSMPGRAWGFDATHPWQTWHSLSVISSVWDLVGEKVSSNSRVWWQSMVRFLRLDQRAPILTYIEEMRGDLKIADYPRTEFVQRFTEAVKRRKANRKEFYRGDYANLRRMNGLWRIPFFASDFWVAPRPQLKVTMNRGKDGAPNEIDTVVFKP